MIPLLVLVLATAAAWRLLGRYALPVDVDLGDAIRELARRQYRHTPLWSGTVRLVPPRRGWSWVPRQPLKCRSSHAASTHPRSTNSTQATTATSSLRAPSRAT